MDSLYIWLLVYFLLASSFYILDKKGSYGFKWLHNLGRSPDDIIANPDKGFVYKQTSMKKWVFAGGFDLVLSAVLWYFNALDMGLKILLSFLGFFAIFAGFWFGGILVEKLSKGAKNGVKFVDDIENGVIDPKKSVEKVFESSKQAVNSTVDEITEGVKGKLNFRNDEVIEEVVEVPTKPVISSEEKKKQDDEALEFLKNFQNK
jgi:hypothetical protein